jgi:hypothetical protein
MWNNLSMNSMMRHDYANVKTIDATTMIEHMLEDHITGYET